MAKELTHILIAQDVIKQIKESGQQLLAQLIEENLPAYYLGSIIPDALFYDVPPFRLNPHKHIWLSRAFHLKEKAKNDEKAVSLFRSIAANPRVWRLKMAFAAGIITHTVTDRIFHELIEYYTSTWGEKGTVAMTTHREIETLIDTILLRPLNMGPREIHLGHLDALKRAHDQQRLFLKLFATLPLYHIMKLSNKFVAGHLGVWHSLFYPKDGEPQSFPVLDKIRLNSLGDESLFDGVLQACRKAASSEAICHINIALKTFA
jgi:hypothetical protein